jgi:hypothetical protein
MEVINSTSTSGSCAAEDEAPGSFLLTGLGFFVFVTPSAPSPSFCFLVVVGEVVKDWTRSGGIDFDTKRATIVSHFWIATAPLNTSPIDLNTYTNKQTHIHSINKKKLISDFEKKKQGIS